MARCGSRLLTTALVGVVALASSSAFAQAPPAATPPAATPPAATPPAGTAPNASKPDSADPVERARLHYERGLQLFNEENFDAALFEFERAYELAPSYKILYNMGRIQRQQNNYAAAMRSYARYLREGGAGVPADRRTEVEGELAVLKPRVAAVTVKVNVDGADVYADDIPVCTATIESSCIGKSPLEAPILVNGGRHKITATKQGYAPATSLVSVVGSDAIDVKLDLVSYDRPAAPPTNPWKLPMLIGWGVTGAGVVTAIVTGVLANKASSDESAATDRLGVTRAELDDAKHKTRTLATVSDAFFIGSAVTAGVSTYLTIRALRWKGESSSVKLEVGANRVVVGGQF
jgi:hypothetical protein